MDKVRAKNNKNLIAFFVFFTIVFLSGQIDVSPHSPLRTGLQQMRSGCNLTTSACKIVFTEGENLLLPSPLSSPPSSSSLPSLFSQLSSVHLHNARQICSRFPNQALRREQLSSSLKLVRSDNLFSLSLSPPSPLSLFQPYLLPTPTQSYPSSPALSFLPNLVSSSHLSQSLISLSPPPQPYLLLPSLITSSPALSPPPQPYPPLPSMIPSSHLYPLLPSPSYPHYLSSTNSWHCLSLSASFCAGPSCLSLLCGL